ncbi:hypothetical protein BDB00DRAFT_559795 [Zychaea mexicana]|uniref:uncharacterized protein n=1 Tax=Zychaea mexicana TaxID=64656 RepID=UPI0022FEF474|nr:uncharacterized protein BDB00DRAFT_559795 [Zychaea mexicana]KAI9490377.1 hypothetical protein BDB00DRAFT_559795 [Zychaea mexicana]
MANNDVLIILIPVALCLLGILLLLEIRERLRAGPGGEGDSTLLRTLDEDSDSELLDDYIDETAEDNNDRGEGSSTGVHVRKIGKKKGEKLRRKEQMRQYREYMNQQRDLRRAQEEVLEEEFQRKKAEEAIRRADEVSEKRRKEKEKKAKQEEKERVKREKAEVKEAKKKRSRFDKYSGRIADAAKRLKICNMETLANASGFSEEEATDILKELCATSSEFRLSLWSGSTFMFVTEEDYAKLAAYLERNGKTSIKHASHDILAILQA